MSMSTVQIKCGRFDQFVAIDCQAPVRVSRIQSKKRKVSKGFEFIPISTNGALVFHKGKYSEARDFLSSLTRYEKQKLIVLTNKEKNLLAEIEVECGAKVRVFEINFKHVPDISYSNDLEKQYLKLEKNISQLRKKDILELSLGVHFTKINLHRIARKLRFKNSLDKNFYFTNQKGIQEVFRLYEKRPDRSIVALDFNSMYPSCMDGDFLDAKKLEYWLPTKTVKDIKNLNDGLYRVTFKGPLNESHIFDNTHPFHLTHQGESFKFILEKNQEIECLAFRFEISVYQKYFKSIEVHEGIISKTTISHPLYKKALRLYKEKKNYESQCATYMKNLLQFELQTLYAATSTKQYKEMKFANWDDAVKYLVGHFQLINSRSRSANDTIMFLVNLKLVKILNTGNEIRLSLLNTSSDMNVFSLSSQIVAKARIKVIEAVNELAKWPNLELCYINIDSIHVSIKTEDLPNFLKHNEPLINNNLGALKVQAIADRGYWFDIGRYWLFEKDEVIKFKNKLFNSKASKAVFTRFRKLKTIVRFPFYPYVRNHYTVIENCFSYNKRLSRTFESKHDYYDFERYRHKEVCDLDVAHETINHEIMKSKYFKTSLFNSIATR